MERELIIVLDFGGQYKQLIARRVRECKVYCEIHPHTLELEKIKAMEPKGIILTGGPASVYKEDSPTCPPELFELGIPILGICYGSQLMAYRCGGVVKTAPVSEYGHTEVVIDAKDSALFQNITLQETGSETGVFKHAARQSGNARRKPGTGFSDAITGAWDAARHKHRSGKYRIDDIFHSLAAEKADSDPAYYESGKLPEKGEGNGKESDNSTVCWMSHTDYIAEVPEGFSITAHTAHCPVAAMEDPARKLYAVQFHPEVSHTPEGTKMIRGFVMDVCGCRGDWEMSSFVETTIRELREKIGQDHVILGLSGGVDSSVTAGLLSRAIGSQLHCVFVDHGLMRKDEGDEVEAIFGPAGNFDLNFTRVNARETFFLQLMGESSPESKRTVIGSVFPQVFGEEAKKLKGTVRYIAQGTIYPDVVESGGDGTGDVIKSHHNVGGLPKELVKKLGFDENPIEPLRMLFKDEVRRVGLELGIPRELVYRQPFPGPGLGVRIVGEITPDKVRTVQEADYIFREELARAGVDQDLGQYFAALSNMRTVGVQGDHRTYGMAVVLRAVLTSDFMTAEAAELPWPVLQRCMTRIINEVPGVNRVLYDITSKPPGTIELE